MRDGVRVAERKEDKEKLETDLGIRTRKWKERWIETGKEGWRGLEQQKEGKARKEWAWWKEGPAKEGGVSGAGGRGVWWVVMLSGHGVPVGRAGGSLLSDGFLCLCWFTTHQGSSQPPVMSMGL